MLFAEGRISEAEKFARSAVQALEAGDQQALLAEALTTHGIVLARLGRFQHARLTLQSAVEVAQHVGDNESAGQALLIIIEELGERLTTAELGAINQRAFDLLANSQHPGTKDRLLACARRVLFLAGVLPAPPSWAGFSLKDALLRYEGLIIERALIDAGGVVSRAARLLGYEHHTTVVNKINQSHRHLLATRSPIIPRHQSLMFIEAQELASRPLTILHVEAWAEIANAVKEVLATEGWNVETCMQGTDALNLLESVAHYDVLIFAHQLPDADGIELIRQTRRLTHRQQTPLIMLSGREVEAEARQAGANAVLRTPNDMQRIAETVARLLARKPRAKHSDNGADQLEQARAQRHV